MSIQVVKYRVCQAFLCENHILNENNTLCYFHVNIKSPQSLKTQPEFEEIIEYIDPEINIIKDFETKIGWKYMYMKIWQNDDTYKYEYY